MVAGRAACRKGFSPDTIKLLEAKGQKVALKEAMGSTQSIMMIGRTVSCTVLHPTRARWMILTAGIIGLAALLVGRGPYCQGKPKVAFYFIIL